MPVSQTVYGLKVRTSVALPGLAPMESDRAGGELRIHLKESHLSDFVSSDPRIAVSYVSNKSEADDEPILKARVLDSGERLGLFYGDGCRFAVQRQGREIWVDWPANYTLEDACTYLLGPVLGFVLRLRGVTALHASAVAIGDAAIALVGAPGAGKSTTAAAFALQGFPVISDDVVALQEKNGLFCVQPGYPRVNLWPDSARALFGTEDALPKITRTWSKRYLPLENDFRFVEASLPLRAIYILEAREKGLTAPVVQEIRSAEALLNLVANTYVNYLLDREMRCQEFDLLSRMVTSVPVRRVHAVADLSCTKHLCEIIASDAAKINSTSLEELTAAALNG